MPYNYNDTSVINGNAHTITLVNENIHTITLMPKNTYTLTLATPIVFDGETADYNHLINKPVINRVTLIGSLTLDDLGIQPAGNYPNSPLTEEDLEHLIVDEI